MLPTAQFPTVLLPQLYTDDVTVPAEVPAPFQPLHRPEPVPVPFQPLHLPEPVPAQPAVATPLYEGLVAEWAAFGRHYPGADEDAASGAPW
ncbi:hypothetical protein [Streptomyces sp. NBC_01264]|uniref:hypothetical protein n=1 Tax=Streptomyces sp. NBC_01264 TaxID=2903804 RepID=UPI0022563F13|nr:hypothetical protein [Streptomyces sp. NBC_01264]MCX4781790.1 hypothetical protein [Streptomyces sp. NBC_01264]